MSTQTIVGPGRRAVLVCPICLHEIPDWAAAPLATLNGGRYIDLVRVPSEGEEAWAQRFAAAYRRCPGGGSGDPHYLPQAYGEYQRVVIGVIGASQAGKSHLLAAMIGQLVRGEGRLLRLDLKVDALDLRIHQRYMAQIVEPFLAGRKGVGGTIPAPVEFTDALKITNLRTGVVHAVSFFDVAGEVLERAGDDGPRFVGAVDALLFVVDPLAIPGLLRPDPAGLSDKAFDAVLTRLAARPGAGGEFLPFPSATVVAKADELEYGLEPLPRAWLRRDRSAQDEELDLATVEQESEDVFAYLYGCQAEPWLRPALRCARSTLHFASATNARLTESGYPALTFRQRRVLKPLLALFAMTGVLDPGLLEPPAPIPSAPVPPAPTPPAPPVWPSAPTPASGSGNGYGG